MTPSRPTRHLLVVAPPSPWIPADGHDLGPWTLAVDRADDLEALPAPTAAWDVVAFQVGSQPPDATMAALRGVAPDATFLPVAGHPDPREALFYLKHGAFEYLEEPLPAREFLRALAEAIENRDTFQEILDLNRTLEAQKEQLLAEKAELEQMNRELEAVSQLARSLAATLEPEEILHHLGRSVLGTVPCSRVLVGLMEPGKACEQTRLHLSVGADGSAREEPSGELRWLLRDRKRAPWMATVLQEGRVLQVQDPATDPRTAGTPLALLHRFPFVKLPLCTRGRVVGTVSVEGCAPDHDLAAEELDLLGIFADTTAMALENAHLYHTMCELSARDELTGLYNRRHLMAQFAAEWQDAERRDNPLSMLMVDIDHFKSLNDGNDHLVGDEALRKLASTLLRNTRGIDTVARFGGEEFVVLLPRTGDDTARRVAEKLRGLVEKTSFPGEAAVPGGNLTVSVGVAGRLPEDTEFQQLLERADGALYRAKQAGRNQVHVWQEEARRAEAP